MSESQYLLQIKNFDGGELKLHGLSDSAELSMSIRDVLAVYEMTRYEVQLLHETLGEWLDRVEVGDVVRSKAFGFTYKVIGVHGDQAWISTIGREQNFLVTMRLSELEKVEDEMEKSNE